MQSSGKEQFSLHVTDEGKIIRSNRITKKRGKRENLWVYLGLVGDFGIAIVTPIAAGAYLGGMIDTKSASYPRYTIAFLIGGSIISVVGFVQIIQAIIRRTK